MTLFEHTLPVAWLVAVVLLIVAGAVLSWRRHLGWSKANLLLVLGYAGAIALLVWCLLLPGYREDTTRLLKPKFAILLDTSQSMTLRPRDDVASRWDTAREVLALPSISALTADCDVELFTIAGELDGPLTLAAAGERAAVGTVTHLRNGLNDLARRFSGLQVTGVLVLSDGLETREAFDDWAAEERAFPVYSLPLEEPDQWVEEAAIRVETITTPRRVSVGWQSECKVRVSGQGTGGEPVLVQLFKDGNLIGEQPTRIAADGGEREVVFDLEHDAIGMFNYRAFVPPLAGEGNTNDNAFVVSVQVTDARNRLLYVEGVPRWEYKFMRRALLAQQNVTPVIFYSGPDGAPRRGTDQKGVSPTMTPTDLGFFKIVILGNLSAQELGSERAANLVKFVDDGGSLVVLGGSRGWDDDGLNTTELGKILPVRGQARAPLTSDDPFPVSLTDAARAHPAFAGDSELWSVVPPLLSVYPGFSLSPTAQTLVEVDTPQGRVPVVATHRYGQGKVAVVLTDSLWKWQLAPNASENKPYVRFWTQMISWLLPDEEEGASQAIQLFADREQLHLGEEIQITARVTGEKEPGTHRVRAALKFPDERTVDYDMNAQWVAAASGQSFPGHLLSYTAREPGFHVVTAEADADGRSLTSDPFSFYVKPYSPETIPRPIDEALLRTLTETSGGEYFASLEDLDRGLGEIRPAVIEEISAEFNTLWRTWPVMIAIVVLVAVSWINRKVRGMP